MFLFSAGSRDRLGTRLSLLECYPNDDKPGELATTNANGDKLISRSIWESIWVDRYRPLFRVLVLMGRGTAIHEARPVLLLISTPSTRIYRRITAPKGTERLLLAMRTLQ